MLPVASIRTDSPIVFTRLSICAPFYFGRQRTERYARKTSCVDGRRGGVAEFLAGVAFAATVFACYRENSWRPTLLGEVRASPDGPIRRPTMVSKSVCP